MSSERAGVHTSGTLNRGLVEDVLQRWRDSPLRNDGMGDVLDALEACVVPDPRIAALEAWQREVADGTGYLIPETGEIAPAGVIVDRFKAAQQAARDFYELHPDQL